MVVVARRLLAGLLALAYCAEAHAQTPATVNVSVDGAALGTPLERVWPFHGYDEVNYTTLPEGKALLGTLAALHTAPVYVRSHFLLNTGDGTPAPKWGSTNVYTEDAVGTPIYSWPLTDGILGSITAVGAFPLVELGFMPQALSAHPSPYVNASTLALNGGCFYPPSNYSKWADLIRAWARHSSESYPDAAARWLWELWNEPDSGYWHGTFDEYAQLYDYTESALHEVLPDAPLGGPAVVDPSGSFLSRFLEHCRAGRNAVTGSDGTRLDLVTFHAKGGVAIAHDHVELDLGHQLRLHRAGFEAVAAFSEFKHTPIYITEADPDGCAACPAAIIPGAAYRTSTAYGAYEIAMMKHTLELAADEGVQLGGIVTWAFTFPGTPYFAGYRALTTNGINLPVLSAFKLLGLLSGSRLPLSSSGAHALTDVLASGVRDQPELDGMATRDGSTLRVLVWNYHDDLVTAAPTPVRLSVKIPVNFGYNARISHLRVDEAHGDAHTVWVAQGKPASPTDAQVVALQQAMDPSSLVPDRTVRVAATGSVELDFDLPRFGVSLITILPADSSDNGADTDGNESTSSLTARGGCACRSAGRSRSDAWGLWGASVLLLVSRLRRAGARAWMTSPCSAVQSSIS